MKLNIAFLCHLILGGDTRVRVSYQEEELELRLPFGSHSRLFLSEVNRAWSGRSALRDIRMWHVYMTSSCHCFYWAFSQLLKKPIKFVGKKNPFKNEWAAINWHSFKQYSSTNMDPHFFTCFCWPLIIWLGLSLDFLFWTKCFTYVWRASPMCKEAQIINSNHLFGGNLLSQTSISLRLRHGTFILKMNLLENISKKKRESLFVIVLVAVVTPITELQTGGVTSSVSRWVDMRHANWETHADRERGWSLDGVLCVVCLCHSKCLRRDKRKIVQEGRVTSFSTLHLNYFLLSAFH